MDWAVLRGYEPSPLIQSLADDTAMTPYAKRLFYVNRPAVEDKTEFNEHCTDPSDQVSVLGCFTGNRLGIYIYNVTDERLDGVQPVTAAHEMLHQAYQRLSRKERARIDALLQHYYDTQASDTLKDKIDTYRSSEPEHLLNEMHSIFGTEAANLPAELEEYYRRYFADRQRVLALHQKYQSEFDRRIAQINEYDTRLSELKTRIETNKAEIAASEKDLQARRAQMEADLAANRIIIYNAAVPGYNRSVQAYRSLVDKTNEMVDDFNRQLAERNALAIQERELEDAIDSAVDTAARR